MAETATTMYDTLVNKLQSLSGVEFAEYEWRTRPAGDFGTVQLDFEAKSDDGDDLKQDRAWEGSVDLFTQGNKWTIVAAVESVLAELFGNSWYLNSTQYERETGLIHREFVFQMESW